MLQTESTTETARWDFSGDRPVFLSRGAIPFLGAPGMDADEPVHFIKRNGKTIPLRGGAMAGGQQQGGVTPIPGVGLQGRHGDPVEVSVEANLWKRLGYIKLPTANGQIDPHLLDAYKHALKDTHEIGEFRIDPRTGHATAKLTPKGQEPVAETPVVATSPADQAALHEKVQEKVKEGLSVPEAVAAAHVERAKEPSAGVRKDPTHDKLRSLGYSDEDIAGMGGSGSGAAMMRAKYGRAKEAGAQAAVAKPAEQATTESTPAAKVEPTKESPAEPVIDKDKLHARVVELRAQGQSMTNAVVNARREQGYVPPKPADKPAPKPWQTQPAPQQAAKLTEQPKPSQPDARAQRLAAKVKALKEGQQATPETPKAEPGRAALDTAVAKAKSVRPADTEEGFVKQKMAEARKTAKWIDPGDRKKYLQGAERDAHRDFATRGRTPGTPEAPALHAQPTQASLVNQNTPAAEPDKALADTAGRYRDLMAGGMSFADAKAHIAKERESGGNLPATEARGGDRAERINHSKAEIARQLIERFKNEGGDNGIEDDKVLEGVSGDPFTFHKRLPGEVKDFLEGRAHLKRYFTVTDDAGKAGGADVMGNLGEDKYFGLLERRVGSETKAALEHARNHWDPEVRLQAAIHDTMPERSSRKPVEHVEPQKLEPGHEASIGGVPVKVETKDGQRMLTDGGDLPDTPLDALSRPLPIDKGSLTKREQKPEPTPSKFTGSSAAMPGPAFPKSEGRAALDKAVAKAKEPTGPKPLGEMGKDEIKSEIKTLRAKRDAGNLTDFDEQDRLRHLSWRAKSNGVLTPGGDFADERQDTKPARPLAEIDRDLAGANAALARERAQSGTRAGKYQDTLSGNAYNHREALAQERLDALKAQGRSTLEGMKAKAGISPPEQAATAQEGKSILQSATERNEKVRRQRNAFVPQNKTQEDEAAARFDALKQKTRHAAWQNMKAKAGISPQPEEDDEIRQFAARDEDQPEDQPKKEQFNLPHLRGRNASDVEDAMNHRDEALPRMEEWVRSMEATTHPKARQMRGMLETLKRSRESSDWLRTMNEPGDLRPAWDPHAIAAAQRADRQKYGLAMSRGDWRDERYWQPGSVLLSRLTDWSSPASEFGIGVNSGLLDRRPSRSQGDAPLTSTDHEDLGRLHERYGPHNVSDIGSNCVRCIDHAAGERHTYFHNPSSGKMTLVGWGPLNATMHGPTQPNCTAMSRLFGMDAGGRWVTTHEGRHVFESGGTGSLFDQPKAMPAVVPVAMPHSAVSALSALSATPKGQPYRVRPVVGDGGEPMGHYLIHGGTGKVHEYVEGDVAKVHARASELGGHVMDEPQRANIPELTKPQHDADEAEAGHAAHASAEADIAANRQKAIERVRARMAGKPPAAGLMDSPSFTDHPVDTTPVPKAKPPVAAPKAASATLAVGGYLGRIKQLREWGMSFKDAKEHQGREERAGQELQPQAHTVHRHYFVEADPFVKGAHKHWEQTRDKTRYGATGEKAQPLVDAANRAAFERKAAENRHRGAVQDAIHNGIISSHPNYPEFGPKTEAPPTPDDLPAFAAHVQHLADAHDEGFGPNKVLISHVYGRAKAHDPSLSEESFKGKLKAANTAGLLKLSRLDLAGAVHPADAAASYVNLEPGRGATAPDSHYGKGEAVNSAHFIQAAPKERKMVRGPDSAMQKDLFGKEFIHSSGVGEQAPMFHEPVNVAAPKTERIGASAEAVRPENTSEMFPAKPLAVQEKTKRDYAHALENGFEPHPHMGVWRSVGSKQSSLWANLRKGNIRANRLHEYSTSFGPNSRGYEVEHPNLETAVRKENEWLKEQDDVQMSRLFDTNEQGHWVTTHSGRKVFEHSQSHLFGEPAEAPAVVPVATSHVEFPVAGTFHEADENYWRAARGGAGTDELNALWAHRQEHGERRRQAFAGAAQRRQGARKVEQVAKPTAKVPEPVSPKQEAVAADDDLHLRNHVYEAHDQNGQTVGRMKWRQTQKGPRWVVSFYSKNASDPKPLFFHNYEKAQNALYRDKRRYGGTGVRKVESVQLSKPASAEMSRSAPRPAFIGGKWQRAA